MNSPKTRKPRSARPQRAAAPPLPPFEQLDTTHRQVLVSLERLQGLVDDLASEGITDRSRAIAAEICQFFDASAREHHAAEERHVFPELLNSGDAALVPHVQRLQQDHGWLEEDWIELQPQLRAVAEGYNWYDPDFLRAAIPVFTELYRDHIALEEDVVYPASRGLKR
jgi:hemerythrin-like domain-containing protein